MSHDRQRIAALWNDELDMWGHAPPAAVRAISAQLAEGDVDRRTVAFREAVTSLYA